MKEMVDSGLPWVGTMPAEWKVLRGKNVVRKLKRSVKDTDGVITCFRDGEVTLRSKRRDDGFTFSEQEVGYQGIEPGDLVIHGMDGFAGAIGISDSRGKATPVLNVLDSKYDKRYLMYYFRAIAKCGYFESVATGIRVRTCDTNWNKISVTPCLVPSPAEQSRIAAFLDDRCAKIDEAIARHQALIEKLDEYRKAVISKAVTKGIRGERGMKDSGIDWIGDIPAEWSIIKGRYIYNVLSGYPLDSNNFSMTDGYPMIRIRDITSGEIETYYDGDFPSQYIVTKGELLIGMDGDFRVRQWDNIDAVLNQRCCKITERKYAIRRYLFYVLPLYLKRINDVIFGTTVKHLSVPDLKLAELPIPSPEEQQEIVEYLDSKCAAIDSAKERHAQLIAKLEEYKKSLVYNAVTGKIIC